MTFPHLRLPNDIVDRLAQLHLNGTQWQILWAIFRQTLCWQKKGAWGNHPFPISINDLSQATALDGFQIKRELAPLIKWNLVSRGSGGGRGNKPLTSFNLDYTSWKVPNGSESATLLARYETVANPLPIGDQLAELAKEDIQENGSESATLSGLKGSDSARKTVANPRPFTRESATLSVPNVDSPKETIKKHIKKHIYKETEEEIQLPEWINEDSWNGYLEMRRAKNKVPTPRAIELVIKSLASFREQGLDPNEILDQSTKNGWTDVYALKKGSQRASATHKDFSRDW